MRRAHIHAVAASFPAYTQSVGWTTVKEHAKKAGKRSGGPARAAAGGGAGGARGGRASLARTPYAREAASAPRSARGRRDTIKNTKRVLSYSVFAHSIHVWRGDSATVPRAGRSRIRAPASGVSPDDAPGGPRKLKHGESNEAPPRATHQRLSLCRLSRAVEQHEHGALNPARYLDIDARCCKIRGCVTGARRAQSKHI